MSSEWWAFIAVEPRHQHTWELTWEHIHGGFVIAEEHRCATCPAVRRSKVEGQDCDVCQHIDTKQPA